jgi:hypothetical protein
MDGAYQQTFFDTDIIPRFYPPLSKDFLKIFSAPLVFLKKSR